VFVINLCLCRDVSLCLLFREEAIYNVDASVDGFTNLTSSLEEYTTSERLDGDNQYFCETCESKVDALRYSRYIRNPSITIFKKGYSIVYATVHILQ
jgi:hypothetical protein